MTLFPELTRAAMATLAQCNLQPAEKVVIFTDSEREPAVVDGFYTALVSLGVDPVVVRVMSRFPESAPPSAAIAACADADLLLDLASFTWSYNPAMHAILAGGTRILQCLLPTKSLIERVPDERLVQRLQTASRLLEGRSQIRITDKLGTGLRADRGNRRWHAQAGTVTAPGQYDLYGTCMVNTAPIESSVSGVVYLDGPLILYGDPEYLFAVKTPVRITVERGRLSTIDTSSADGRKIERWFQQFKEPDINLIAHVGFGLHPDYDLDHFDLAAWESIEGGVLVAFGANNSPALGGSHGADGHMDAILLHATFEVDGLAFVTDGVPAAMLETA